MALLAGWFAVFGLYCIAVSSAIRVSLSSTGANVTAEGAILWSTAPWNPRPPKDGDDVVIDLSCSSGCSVPPVFLLVDISTPKVESFDVTGTATVYQSYGTSVVVANQLNANAMSFTGQTRLFLATGAIIVGQTLDMDAASFIGGNGVVNVATSTIEGSIIPGITVASESDNCCENMWPGLARLFPNNWPKAASQQWLDAYGDLEFRGDLITGAKSGNTTTRAYLNFAGSDPEYVDQMLPRHLGRNDSVSKIKIDGQFVMDLILVPIDNSLDRNKNKTQDVDTSPPAVLYNGQNVVFKTVSSQTYTCPSNPVCGLCQTICLGRGQSINGVTTNLGLDGSDTGLSVVLGSPFPSQQQQPCNGICNTQRSTCIGTLNFCQCFFNAEGFGWSDAACSTPVCPNNCGGELSGTCVDIGTQFPACRCKAGYSGTTCQSGGCGSGCGAHGVCDVLGDTPVCNCNQFDGTNWYYGSNCQFSSPSCPPSCGHSVSGCNAQNASLGCGSCAQNWRGSQCQIQICPGYDAATSTRNCNGNGVCDSNSTCSCLSTHTGTACEILLAGTAISNTTPMTTAPTSSSISIALIVGLAVGVPGAIILAIALVMLIAYWTRRQRDMRTYKMANELRKKDTMID